MNTVGKGPCSRIIRFESKCVLVPSIRFFIY